MYFFLSHSLYEQPNRYYFLENRSGFKENVYKQQFEYIRQVKKFSSAKTKHLYVCVMSQRE